MNFDRHRKLRKVAVLVASLGEPLARTLLEDLPQREADQVRSAVEQLGVVDPEERDDVLDEFHRNAKLTQRNDLDAVQMDPSLLEKIQQEPEALSIESRFASALSKRSLIDAQPETIAQLLADEHPQTAALVVSRLPTHQAAEVVQALSPSLQAEVLARLAQLDTTDQQAIEVVESHLNDQIGQHRERQQRMAAGMELVNEILEKTKPEQQDVLLANLSQRDPALAKRFAKPKQALHQTISKKPRLAAQQAVSLEAAIANVRSLHTIRKADTAQQRTEISNPMQELERHNDASLLAGMGRLDHRVVSLALAGASDRLLKRILRSLPRSQAKAFRKQLLVSDPTRLSDMLAAQQEFLLAVRENARP